MKIRVIFIILLAFVSLPSCKQTYTFLSKNFTSVVVRKPNTKVKIDKLNKTDKYGRRMGWHLIFNSDTTIFAKYKNGEINGRVIVIDSSYQIIQKYKMRNNSIKGIVVDYYKKNYQWTSIMYYDKKGDRTILRKSRGHFPPVPYD